MKVVPLLLGLLGATIGGPVGADTWQATTKLIPSSPRSCPKVEFAFQLSLEGARFNGTDPNSTRFESNVASDGAVLAEYQAARAGRVKIFGNAHTRELELIAGASTVCRYSLVPTQSQDTSGSEWAIGRWDGHITRLGGAGGAANSGLQTEQRVLIIAKTGAGLICRWSFSETVTQELTRRCRIGANSISLVTLANTDVELTRSGENSLTGTFVDADNISAYYGKTKVFLTRSN